MTLLTDIYGNEVEVDTTGFGDINIPNIDNSFDYVGMSDFANNMGIIESMGESIFNNLASPAQRARGFTPTPRSETELVQEQDKPNIGIYIGLALVAFFVLKGK